MKQNIFERMEKYLKETEEDGKKIVKGNYLLPIRFFDGCQEFSTIDGAFRSKSLEGSLDLFLVSQGY